MQVLNEAPRYPEGTAVRLMVKGAKDLAPIKKLALVKIAIDCPARKGSMRSPGCRRISLPCAGLARGVRSLDWLRNYRLPGESRSGRGFQLLKGARRGHENQPAIRAHQLEADSTACSIRSTARA